MAASTGSCAAPERARCSAAWWVKARTIKVAAYAFFLQHARWMDYAASRRRKLPIGNGVTEAACKIVFSQRFKCSGMKWDIAGGAVILELRVALLSFHMDTQTGTRCSPL